jgi:hypothetical protein
MCLKLIRIDDHYKVSVTVTRKERDPEPAPKRSTWVPQSCLRYQRGLRATVGVDLYGAFRPCFPPLDILHLTFKPVSRSIDILSGEKSLKTRATFIGHTVLLVRCPSRFLITGDDISRHGCFRLLPLVFPETWSQTLRFEGLIEDCFDKTAMTQSPRSINKPPIILDEPE